MKVLIIGSGGREHALAWKIKQSSLVKKIYCAPGNAGIAQIADCVDIDPLDIKALVKFAKDKGIDLTVVGPEAPLTAGIVDTFEKEKLKIFGPSQAAARLEGSKVFAKEFLHQCNIPTAPYKILNSAKEAYEFLKQAQFPLVVKADGLASGKGVVICENVKQAHEAVKQIMEDKIFREAGKSIVIEECLIGEEASIIAVSDGIHYLMFESSQDHKRIFDDDLGPNTGGMGAYSPAPIITSEAMKIIEARVIEPTIRGLRRAGTPFKGVLYAGLMITAQGPMVLEFNVRFGDPETQAILPRLKTDLVAIMLAACNEGLNKVKLEWDARDCVCVVMTSGGYPGKYETDKDITGLETIKEKDTFVFHAGTKKKGDKILTAGGRVLGVTSLGKGIQEAIDRAYAAVEKIRFERAFFRRDIAAKALETLDYKKIISRR